MGKKVFILGSSGFIGSWLLKRFSSGSLYRAVGCSSADCDLLSPDSVRKALSSVAPDDVMVVLSCITRLKENSHASLVKNVRMACNLAGFLEAHPVSQLIYFSTVDVYGLIPEGMVISESLQPNPDDYYALSKLAGEFILKRALSGSQAAFLSLRLSGVYGPGDGGKSTVGALLSSLARTGKIKVFGDGRDTRDFVFVDDACKLVEDAIRHKTSGVVNVATGKSRSIAEIANLVLSLAGRGFAVEFLPPPAGAGKRQRCMEFDISMFRRLFPGFAFMDLKAGLALCMNKAAAKK
ncbi:NAD(P)-dependent oxidoreductase [Candidatus Woesearchaeota archaeon]|nr:NAD(P)-dependent oxidoreductase [Candidatus Woesearchaeota archaeon]